MLNHVVTFELDPDAPEDQAEQICDALRGVVGDAARDALLRRRPRPRLREGNATFAITATFDDAEAFLAYVAHPSTCASSTS